MKGMEAMAIDKYHLNLAGEYRVCSEILKRGVFATITYGNKKGADVYAVGTNRRAAVIEVKASNSSRFVTGFYQKYKTPRGEHPDFWVLYSVQENDGGFVERFFILTHRQMANAQARSNGGRPYDPKYIEKWAGKGVDNVSIGDVAEHESRWDKIVDYCTRLGENL